MKQSLLDTLFQHLEFLDDHAGREIDTHDIVREQEIIAARFQEDLTEEQQRRLVGGLTELRDALDAELVTEILEGLDLLDEYDED